MSDPAAPAAPAAGEASAAHDARLDDARRRCDALRAALSARTSGDGGPVAEGERAAWRAEIAALIRAADAEVQAWRAVADAARALPELWKQLPAASAFPPTTAAAASDSRPEASRDATRPTAGRSNYLGASTYAAKGWTAYAAADYAGAGEAFERALALAPDDAEATALLAWARAAAGRDEDALLAAQHVLVARPRGPAAALARVAVGRVCLDKSIDGEAIEHLARVVRDNDDRRAVLYATLYLGVAYQRRGMYDDAVTFMRRALALGPNLVEARYELGRTYWAAGAQDDARAEWRAGAAAGAFSAWGKRCEERLEEARGDATAGGEADGSARALA